MESVRRLPVLAMTVVIALAATAFELRPVYGVIVAHDGVVTARGYMELDFDDNTYIWSNQHGKRVARGDYRLVQGRLSFDDELEKWGEGIPQPDGRIVFGDDDAYGYYVRFRPTSRVTVWPF